MVQGWLVGQGCKIRGVARYTSFRLAPLARQKASSNIDELAFCFIFFDMTYAQNESTPVNNPMTYVYQREDGTKFEVEQSMKDKPLKKCPETGQKCRRVITGGYATLFMGNGWPDLNN